MRRRRRLTSRSLVRKSRRRRKGASWNVRGLQSAARSMPAAERRLDIAGDRPGGRP